MKQILNLLTKDGNQYIQLSKPILRMLGNAKVVEVDIIPYNRFTVEEMDK